MEALGSIASIAGIIDVLAQSLSKLRKIQQKLATTDHILEALVAEFASTKAALRGLQSSLRRHLKDVGDAQLASELELSLTSCARLVHFLNTKVTEFTTPKFRPKTIRQKLRLMIADEETEVYFVHLSHVIVALNTVRQNIEDNAANGHQTSARTRRSQLIFQQVRDDRTSLIALYGDRSSLKSHSSTSTWRSSIIDIHFDFDTQLFMHPSYQHTFRSLLHQVGRKPKARRPHHSTSPNQAASDSPLLDSATQHDRSETQATASTESTNQTADDIPLVEQAVTYPTGDLEACRSLLEAIESHLRCFGPTPAGANNASTARDMLSEEARLIVPVGRRNRAAVIRPLARHGAIRGRSGTM